MSYEDDKNKQKMSTVKQVSHMPLTHIGSIRHITHEK